MEILVLKKRLMDILERKTSISQARKKQITNLVMEAAERKNNLNGDTSIDKKLFKEELTDMADTFAEIANLIKT